MERLSGITIDRNNSGIPIFAHIDLRKHSEFMPILREKGVQINPEIQWTEKMKKSLAESENGEWEVGDINNFWRV